MGALAFLDGGVASAVTSGTAGVTTQDFTCGISTRFPKAARIRVITATTTGSFSPGATLSDGFTDGTTELGCGVQDADGVGTTDTSRVSFDDAVIRLWDETGTTVIAQGSFDSWIAGGIRILWDVIPTGAYQIHYELWFGEDLEVVVGTATPPAVGGGATQVNCGFVPQHVMTWCVAGFPANETIISTYLYEHGHHVRQGSGAFVSRVYQRQCTRNVGTSATATRLVTGHNIWRGGSLPFLLLAATTVLTQTYDNGGGDAGFETESSGTSGTGPTFGYLAIRYGEGHRIDFSTPASETSLGIVNYGSAAWHPQAAFVIGTGIIGSWPTTQNDGVQGATFSTGFGARDWGSGVKEGSTVLYDADAQATTAAETRSNAELLQVFDNGAASLVEAVVDDWLPSGGGIDIEWTTVAGSGRRFLLLLVEEPTFTGTGAGTLPLATGTGAGILEFTGSGAGSFPVPTGTGTGELVFTNNPDEPSAGVFPLATGTGTGTIEFTGTGAGILPTPEATGSGELIFEGSSAGTLPLPTGTGSGALEVVGTDGGGVLPVAQATGSGELVFIGTGAGTLPLATGAGTGELAFEATGAAVLPTPTGTGTAELVFSGSSAGVLPLAEGAGTGTVTVVTFTGSGAGVLPLAQGAGTGELVFEGAAAGTLPLATGSGAGTVAQPITGSGAGVLPLAQGSGTGELVFEGSGAGTFPLVQASGTGQLVFEGAAAGTFPLVEAAGAGTVTLEFTGTGAGVLPLAQGAGAGLLIFEGTSAGVLPLATGLGFGINGELAACVTALLGQYGLACALEGQATRSTALLGQRDDASALLGARTLSEALEGRYDNTSSLEGGIC